MTHLKKKKKKTSQPASVWAYSGKEPIDDIKCPKKIWDS